jgi:glycosyltransferase involved in cell wall biosynthesis
MNKVAIILLTWKRISGLKHTLKALNDQTNKDFTLYISNGNDDEKQKAVVEKHANFFKDTMKIRLSHDGNNWLSFRRMLIGQKLAKEGFDIIMFLDDDIEIPPTYVETCLSHYEPKTYKSGFAWQFTHHGQDYYKKRKRIANHTDRVHYNGTAVSMMDASIFLDDALVKDFPAEALYIEDLWLSYYVDTKPGWRLAWMPIPNVEIGGKDAVALFQEISAGKHGPNKADFLGTLKRMGWKI